MSQSQSLTAQPIKLVDSTGAEVYAGNAAQQSLNVTPVVGTNSYGVLKFASTPTIATASYAAGQVIGGLQTLSAAATNSGGGGIVQSITLADAAKQSAAIDVIFFSAAPSGAFADATTFAPGLADLLKIAGFVSILGSSYSAFSANSFANLNNVGIEYVLGATSLYVVLVSRGNPTYATSADLTLGVKLLQSG